MRRIFGFDIGTTSIGFAVIDHDVQKVEGRILRLGVRVFPEARDADGTPLNQTRRRKRLVRRQIRRRRHRRRLLNELLSENGLLPPFGTLEWDAVMALDPYALRKRAVGKKEKLSSHELGRALYHLSKRRHFRGRPLEEPDEGSESDPDEIAATGAREETLVALRDNELTLGEWLAERDPHQQRRRGVHAHRSVVETEFDRICRAQSSQHAALADERIRDLLRDAIFSQKPVFWRKSTLGACRWVPSAPLCPRGAWISARRRMLEKLNNLAFVGGNARPLDEDECAAILEQLQSQASMTWPAARRALRPLFAARGEPGREKTLKFNIEVGGEKTLLGNPLEARLVKIFGDAWRRHPYQQQIRDAVQSRLWSADYGEVGDQRVVILSQEQRTANRRMVAESFVRDFGVTPDQASGIADLNLPAGWEPYSTVALLHFLPLLEAGNRFGDLVNGPEWEAWRDETFPDRARATGELLDRLPSPATKEESARISKLRNPTVVRTQNELRKVVNNLIELYGKPDLIRLEVARDVGKSKREREDMRIGIRRFERRREEARKDLEAKGIANPSRNTVEKWLLWKECFERCPYTGDQIGFDALFRENLFEVEHIWPRHKSLDNSFSNKTLCRRDMNLRKANRLPFDAFGHDPDLWSAIQTRLDKMTATKGGPGMAPGKVRRFLAKQMPDDFTNRQLNDTGFAAREARAFLMRLWPDLGPETPVTVQPVTGRVTAQLRKLWSLNNILAEDGEKTRADHRHHAIDALTVACAHPGMTQQLSRYLQLRDDSGARRPELAPPWPTIRADAEAAVADIVVSHRVRKKVSGPLHKETTYGDTRKDVKTKTGTYRQFVTRKAVDALSKPEIKEIRDQRVRGIIEDWVATHGGDPKKAFSTYPRLTPNGPEIRRVRLCKIQKLDLMASLANGYADTGLNHHIALFRAKNGNTRFEVVSLFEAARRLARRHSVVNRFSDENSSFVISLSSGETIEIEGIYYVVKGVWANGQVILEVTTDAASMTTIRPTANSLLKKNAKKISVDPIGRIRTAND